ncbi:hypothetical protein L6452_39182 [Arctium lappa]|uniref:Uncharacterized protein n=1 Tax=Arctium lappa TaxID=4217 RepID=A0ACB8XQY5_ARCLA|nr:hypothetical protein L6452_39182 [Arctium lappa]
MSTATPSSSEEDTTNTNIDVTPSKEDSTNTLFLQIHLRPAKINSSTEIILSYESILFSVKLSLESMISITCSGCSCKPLLISTKSLVTGSIYRSNYKFNFITYSRPAVILDRIWNLAFIVVSVLVMSWDESLVMLLRLWIVRSEVSNGHWNSSNSVNDGGENVDVASGRLLNDDDDDERKSFPEQGLL